MKILKILATAGVMTVLAAGTPANAGTLSGGFSTLNGVSTTTNPPKITAAGQIIQVKYMFGVAYYGPDKSTSFTCNAKLEYSDGSAPEMVPIKYPMDAVGRMKQYSAPGKYTVTLTGVGYNGHVGCLGSTSTSMTIEGSAPSAGTKVTAGASAGPAAQPTPAGLGATAGAMTLVSKVTSLTTQYPKIMIAPGGMNVAITIDGTGGSCVLRLSVNGSPGPADMEVDVKNFPTTVNMKFPDLPKENKYFLYAYPGTPKLFFGPACQVSAGNLVLTTYPKPPVQPYITGLYAQGLSTNNQDSAGQDESLIFAVMGNVNNEYIPAQQCGWTLFLVNGNGQGKAISTGAKFSASQTLPAGALAGFPAGAYTLRVKSSSLDDSLASASCGSSAEKKFVLLYSPGTITDVKLKSFGHHVAMAQGSIFNPAHDDGVLEITPVITGPQCNYRVTRTVSGAGVYTPAIHVPGTSDAQPQVIYGADKTFVTVTVHSEGMDNIANMGCKGSVSKTIVVRDDPTLAPEFK